MRKSKGGIMTLTIEVRVKPGKANELYQTRKAKGCLNCHANQGVRDADVHVLSCDWDSRENFEEYIRSGSGSALIGAIELLGDEARIRIGSGAKWEGIEALKRISVLP